MRLRLPGACHTCGHLDSASLLEPPLPLPGQIRPKWLLSLQGAGGRARKIVAPYQKGTAMGKVPTTPAANMGANWKDP